MSEQKRKRGRPPKFNAERADTIVKAVRAGNYIETAAGLAGVDKKTVYAWLRAGARAERKNAYTAFLHAVKEAMAYAEARDLQGIAEASVTDWRARAWRLERRFGRRWAQRQKVEARLEGNAKRPIAVTGGLRIEVVPARVVNAETGEEVAG